MAKKIVEEDLSTMLRILIGLLLVVPLIFSLSVIIKDTTYYYLRNRLEDALHILQRREKTQHTIRGRAKVRRRARLLQERQRYPLTSSPKIFAASRRWDSTIRRILRRSTPFKEDRFAIATQNPLSMRTVPPGPASLLLDTNTTASSPPLAMDDMIDNMKAFSVLTRDPNAESSSLCFGRPEVGENRSGESFIASCDIGTTTTLMTLPIEIRSAVLRELLGDRRVHTHFDHDSGSPQYRPRFTFCWDEISRDLERFFAIKGIDIKNHERHIYEQRHDICFEGENTAEFGAPFDTQQIEDIRSTYKLMRERDFTRIPFEEFQMSLDPDAFDARLSVLAVCRQLRHEGFKALYSSNIFSFVNSYSFNAVMKYLKNEKASLIRKIELSLTFECDENHFAILGPQNIRTHWTVGGPESRYENMWAALDGLTDVTIWVCDKLPIEYLPPSKWNKAREARLKRIRLWLRWVFGDLRDLRKIRKAKVLVSWRSDYQGLATREQILYEADKEMLQSIGDDFAREILVTRPDRDIA